MTMAATIPPAQAAVPRLGLPVTAEQRTLDQVYAGHLAAQASSRYPTAAQPGVVRTAAVPIAPAGAGSSVIINGSAAAVTSPGFAGNGSRLVVKFAHGVSALSGPARRQLKDFAPQVVGHPGLVRVVGHASQRTGDMSYGRHVAANFNVSVDRANAVAGELARLGVDPSRLVVEAVADSQPRYHESMPNGESENRRVEIYLE
jgi:outer membrane protein OmpA-like peptidoglycan-associated protein